MDITISIKNVSRKFDPNWKTLDRIIESVKLIYPSQKVDVYVEFSITQSYVINHLNKLVFCKEPTTVIIRPTKGQITRNITSGAFPELAQAIASTMSLFLMQSDTEQRIWTSSPAQISISDGFTSLKFLDEKPTDSF